MRVEPLQELNNICKDAKEHLSRLKEQVDTIIVAKKKMSDKSVHNVMLSQVGDNLKTVENLETINAKLPNAINNIEKLYQKTNVLLNQQATGQYAFSNKLDKEK